MVPIPRRNTWWLLLFLAQAIALLNNTGTARQIEFLDQNWTSETRQAFVLSQLKLGFSADRVILLSRGGLYDATIAKNFHWPGKSCCRQTLLDRQEPWFLTCAIKGLKHTQIYQWQKQLFDNALAAFETPGRIPKHGDARDRIIEALEAKIRLKNEVVAELLQEHVQLKKLLGNPNR